LQLVARITAFENSIQRLTRIDATGVTSVNEYYEFTEIILKDYISLLKITVVFLTVRLSGSVVRD